MKASETIRTQCCGNLLNDPKCDLVDQVKNLEEDNEALKMQNKIIMELLVDERFSSQ